jgi:hypothetical protein
MSPWLIRGQAHWADTTCYRSGLLTEHIDWGCISLGSNPSSALYRPWDFRGIFPTPRLKWGEQLHLHPTITKHHSYQLIFIYFAILTKLRLMWHVPCVDRRSYLGLGTKPSGGNSFRMVLCAFTEAKSTLRDCRAESNLGLSAAKC